MNVSRWLSLDGALGSFSAAARSDAGDFTQIVGAKDSLEHGLAAVDTVLSEARLGASDLDAVAVGLGPGSFTGLRIAVSYAKGLALGLSRPLVGVSSYDILCDGSTTLPVLAVVHGRTGIACGRLRAVDGDSVCCGTYDAIGDMVASRIAAGPLTVAGGVEGVERKLAERGFTVTRLPVPHSPAASVLRIAATRSADDASLLDASPHEVRPDYGELPAAEVRRGNNP